MSSEARGSRAVTLCAGGAWVLLSIASWVALTVALVESHVGELPTVPGSETAGLISEVEGLTIPDRLAPGETMSSVLERNGFSPAEIYDAARALSAVMDVRHLKPGDEFELSYGTDGVASAVRIRRGRFEEVRLARSEQGWQSESTEVSVERRSVALAGVLEDNLFTSMARLGESAPLTIAVATIFGWDFDFHTQSRNGDRFALVVDKLYRDGEFVGYGDIKAARYESVLSGARVFSAFLYEDPSGTRDYYDADGKSMRKAFLRAPVDFQRISSGFSHNRMHPIHNRRMPHLGVDYVAPSGTPVYSVASGVVVDRGFRGGGGNTVTVRHAMGYTTKYLHLSRFAAGLHQGQRVEQKQVLGYVGATGTATGAHLDFRLIRHGKPVNPLTQIYPPGPPVAAEYRSDFEEKKTMLARFLEAPRLRTTIALD